MPPVTHLTPSSTTPYTKALRAEAEGKVVHRGQCALLLLLHSTLRRVEGLADHSTVHPGMCLSASKRDSALPRACSALSFAAARRDSGPSCTSRQLPFSLWLGAQNWHAIVRATASSGTSCSLSLCTIAGADITSCKDKEVGASSLSASSTSDASKLIPSCSMRWSVCSMRGPLCSMPTSYCKPAELQKLLDQCHRCQAARTPL